MTKQDYIERLQDLVETGKITNEADLTMSNLEEFEHELDYGWDNGVEWFIRAIGYNKFTELYKLAYEFSEGGDYDGGICFTMREYAINRLKEILEEEL